VRPNPALALSSGSADLPPPVCGYPTSAVLIFVAYSRGEAKGYDDTLVLELYGGVLALPSWPLLGQGLLAAPDDAEEWRGLIGFNPGHPSPMLSLVVTPTPVIVPGRLGERFAASLTSLNDDASTPLLGVRDPCSRCSCSNDAESSNSDENSDVCHTPFERRRLLTRVRKPRLDR
jgi:hypothetical protein